MRDKVNRPLVVFDTNVVEGNYLVPMLMQQELYDLKQLRTRYEPAICIKTLYEIFTHIKLGNYPLPYLKSDFGYPKGFTVKKAEFKSKFPSATQFNLEQFFYLCEEWRDMDDEDWVREYASGCRVLHSTDHEILAQDIELKKAFTAWKFELLSFCVNVKAVIEKEFRILYRHEVYGFDVIGANKALLLEESLVIESIVPNEDLEIVVCALALDAAAFVTKEKNILGMAAYSTSPNHRISYVHPDKLKTAVECDFGFRVFNCDL